MVHAAEPGLRLTVAIARRSLVPALSQHSNRPWLRVPCKPAMQERALVQLVDDVEPEPGQMVPEQLRTHVR
jgi:hypothetical protein